MGVAAMENPVSRRPTARLAAAACALVTLLLAGDALAAGSRAEAKLRAKGLTRAGASYILKGEAEAKEAMDRLRMSFQRFNVAQARIGGAQVNAEELAELEREQAYLTQQARSLATVPNRGYGRFRSSGPSQEQQQMRAYTNMELSQVRAAVGQHKQQKPSAAQEKQMKADLADALTASREAAREVRTIVDEVTASYATLADDPEVKESIAALDHETKTAVKLGPSKDFHKLVARLKGAESSLGTGGGRSARHRGTPKVGTRR
jgi:hypothetical protein